jgi:hypothetical protein
MVDDEGLVKSTKIRHGLGWKTFCARFCHEDRMTGSFNIPLRNQRLS